MNFLFNLLADDVSSSTQEPKGSIWTTILLFAVLIGVFVVFGILNSRQRKKQQAQLEESMNKLKVGDKIMTIGRIYGVIVSVDHENETFVIRTGTEENPSYMTIDKMAVYQSIPDKVPENNQSENVVGDSDNAVNSADNDGGMDIDVFEEVVEDDKTEDEKSADETADKDAVVENAESVEKSDGEN